MRISVIIPAFNRRQCVMGAVNSVLRQKDRRVEFEVIVSDDGSTDRTSELFRKLKDRRVKYIYSRKNRGVNAARNAAIKKAAGEYVLLLDSDDQLAPGAAKAIYEARGRLGKVNFFGTAEIMTRKLMYTLQKAGKISYAEWLDRKVLDGEFDPVVHKSVFRKFMFDEDRFCFEGFFWNRVIKKYGLSAFDRVIRLYSFAQENRVSKKLLKVEFAQKRFDDYKRYVKEFGKDYRDHMLGRALADVLEKLSVYAMLSGNAAAARKSIKEALVLEKSAKRRLLGLLFMFGPGVFRLAYSFASRLVKA